MSEFVLAADFNIHNTTWLRHANKTLNEGRYVEIFFKENLLTLLVQEPTHNPDVTNHAADTLDLLLTSHPEKCKIEVSVPLVHLCSKYLKKNFLKENSGSIGVPTGTALTTFSRTTTGRSTLNVGMLILLLIQFHKLKQKA